MQQIQTRSQRSCLQQASGMAAPGPRIVLAPWRRKVSELIWRHRLVRTRSDETRLCSRASRQRDIGAAHIKWIAMFPRRRSSAQAAVSAGSRNATHLLAGQQN